VSRSTSTRGRSGRSGDGRARPLCGRHHPWRRRPPQAPDGYLSTSSRHHRGRARDVSSTTRPTPCSRTRARPPVVRGPSSRATGSGGHIARLGSGARASAPRRAVAVSHPGRGCRRPQGALVSVERGGQGRSRHADRSTRSRWRCAGRKSAS
jgi:hypothetical protein